MPSESELGWAAGLIDGEGCIYLHARRNRSGYTLTIAASNANPINIQELQRILGVGSVALQKRKKGKKPQHRPVWRWQASSIAAEIVLRALLPHLKGKREEARLGLLSRQLLLPHRGHRGTRRPDTEGLVWLQQRLAELKKQPWKTDWPAVEDPQVPLNLGGHDSG